MTGVMLNHHIDPIPSIDYASSSLWHRSEAPHRKGSDGTSPHEGDGARAIAALWPRRRFGCSATNGADDGQHLPVQVAVSRKAMGQSILGAVEDSAGGSIITLKGRPIWSIVIVLVAVMVPSAARIGSSVISHPWAGWPDFAAAMFGCFGPSLGAVAGGAYATRRQNEALETAELLFRTTVLSEHG